VAVPLPLATPALPGEFAIQTYRSNYLTAVDGGGRITDVFHTDATQVGGWERFRTLGRALSGQYVIQTSRGNYLTAVNGGGQTEDPVTQMPPGSGLGSSSDSCWTNTASGTRFRQSTGVISLRSAEEENSLMLSMQV
jgi:hypothetical protein